MSSQDWTFWLMMTNYALALVTVVAVILVVGAVGWDLVVKKAHRVHTIENVEADWEALLRSPHSFEVPGLGLTMADGGEKVNEPKASDQEAKKE
jgi:hypothetical protein